MGSKQDGLIRRTPSRVIHEGYGRDLGELVWAVWKQSVATRSPFFGKKSVSGIHG